MISAQKITDEYFVIEESIQNHMAWCTNVTGLESEDLLKGHPTFTYILRVGEKPSNYYVSFLQPDGLVKHQPFVIRYLDGAWYYRNYKTAGPFENQTIDDIVHMIMHCDRSECRPLAKNA